MHRLVQCEASKAIGITASVLKTMPGRIKAVVSCMTVGRIAHWKLFANAM